MLCMPCGFHLALKCISAAHVPTSSWLRLSHLNLRVLHLNKHVLLKWWVWPVHLQANRMRHMIIWVENKGAVYRWRPSTGGAYRHLLMVVVDLKTENLVFFHRMVESLIVQCVTLCTFRNTGERHTSTLERSTLETSTLERRREGERLHDSTLTQRGKPYTRICEAPLAR